MITQLSFWAKGLGSGTLALLLLVPGGELSALAQTEGSTPTPTADQPEEASPNSEPTTSRFVCELYNGQPTVMYAPASQPAQQYPWAVPQDMGSAWPAERRCQEISARLEAYRPDGLLTLATGIENGYNIVCVTTEAMPGCRIVFTVPNGQDPVLTRDRVFDTLAQADQGQTTVGVTTFAPGSNSILGSLGEGLGLPLPSSQPAQGGRQPINLKPFLDPADGGTGTQLTPPTGRPLNPDAFR